MKPVKGGDQRAEDGGQRAEDRGHPGEMRSAVVNEFHRVKRTEDEKTEIRSQRSEVGYHKER